jgi:DNA phosphorothioation-associated putative methyltransferase
MREAHKNITIGKVLPDAVYIHPDYVSSLPAPVQVKVGVAQALVGVIDECNLIKINKLKEKVSFHCYEDFEKVPHPALLWTTVVDLPKLTTKVWDFETRENPPILHRKETFVGSDFPGYEKFKKLTEKEEKAGLLGHNHIGNKKNWEAFLQQEGYELRGHQLKKLQVTN